MLVTVPSRCQPLRLGEAMVRSVRIGNLDTKDEWPLKDVAEWDLNLAAAALVNAGEVPPKKRLEDLRVVTRAKPEGDRVERWL